MIAKASLKYMGTSPQKVRLVVNQIRGKQVEDALSLLRFSPKVAARDLEKLLRSAVANAEQREERVDVDRLRISRVAVDPGPMLKRMRFRAMGRVFRILRRSCHVSLELDLQPGAGARAATGGAVRTRSGGPLTQRKSPATAAKKAVARKAAAKKKTTKKKLTKRKVAKKTTTAKTTKKAAKKATKKKAKKSD